MLTNITENSVSILEVRDGQNWRRAYVNSEDGRAALQKDFPDAYAELCGESLPWGIEPTVIPEVEPEYEPQPTQLDLIEAQVTYTAMMTDTLLEV